MEAFLPDHFAHPDDDYLDALRVSGHGQGRPGSPPPARESARGENVSQLIDGGA
jgi:hypothetical protein